MMGRKRLTGITGVFLALMLLFTVLSRAADSSGIAFVTLGRPQNMMISHTVEGTGRVEQNQELAVVTEAGLRVSAVLVNEGQQVSQGDVLFELDREFLEEMVLRQKQEMQKLDLQEKDADSQREVNVRRRENEQAQAAENYSLSTTRASVSLRHARSDLEDAKQELEEYRKKKGVSEESSAAEKELAEICEEKSEKYIQAQQDLQTLEWRIEKAVDDALAQAKQGVDASLTENVRTKTWEMGEEIIDEESPGGGETADRGGEVTEETAEKIAEEIVEGAVLVCEEGTEGGSFQAVPGSEEDAEAQDGFIVDITIVPDGTGDTDISGGTKKTESSDVPGGTDGAESVGASSVASESGSIGVTDDTGGPESAGVPGGTSSLDGMDGSDVVILPDITEMPDDGTSLDGAASSVYDADKGLVPDGMDAGSVPSLADGAGSGGVSAPDGGSVGAALTQEQPDGGNGGTAPTQEQPDGGNGGAAPTREQLDEIEKSVRGSYQAELAEARQAVSDALAEKQEAEAALDAYRQEMLAAGGNSAEEEQLVDAVKAAQAAYEDAAVSANEAAVNGNRQIQSAGIPEATDSAGDIYELNREQMELALSKLEKLQEQDGKVRAPVDGIVTKLGITTGEKTPDGTAVLLADLTKGLRLVAKIPQEQEKYIARGDLATVKSGDQKTVLEEIKVETVAPDVEDPSVYLATVQIPAGTLEPGMTATLSLEKKSDAYPCCVPVGALHVDEKNQPYVLAVQEVNSVLGTEKESVKIPVTVQERNDRYAALAQGTLSMSQDIIVSSDKTIGDGSRVRVRN